MNYIKLYDRLISNIKSQNRNKADGYFETHHIVPQCLGGKDELENLVLLTAREHFLAHYILTKLHLSNLKVAYAFHMMGVIAPEKKQQRYGKSWVYHKAKEALNDYQKQNGAIYKHHNVCLKNFLWLKRDGKNKRIDKNSGQYQKLLDEGWMSGRNTFKRMSPTQYTKTKISKANKGMTATKGMILSTRGKTYEEIHGIEKAKEIRQQRSVSSKGRIYSKYIWKLTSPEGKEYIIENVNIINFFKPLFPSVTKTTIVLLNQISKTKKPIHHGPLKGWKAIKVLKDVV